MSKQSKRERAQFRGELLAVLREEVVVLRRIAAAMERAVTVEEIEQEKQQ